MSEANLGPLGMEKQAELCYQDTLKVIADAKQKIFDVTKWIVTLQALVLGLAFSKTSHFSGLIVALPLFIGAMGLALNHAISTELHVHRCTLANLRRTIGGLAYEINRDHVDYFADSIEPKHKNYYRYYRNTSAGILIVASLISFLIVSIHQFFIDS